MITIQLTAGDENARGRGSRGIIMESPVGLGWLTLKALIASRTPLLCTYTRHPFSSTLTPLIRHPILAYLYSLTALSRCSAALAPPLFAFFFFFASTRRAHARPCSAKCENPYKDLHLVFLFIRTKTHPPPYFGLAIIGPPLPFDKIDLCSSLFFSRKLVYWPASLPPPPSTFLRLVTA